MERTQPLYHYVVVRADLPRGLQAAQVCHAAGESIEGPVPEGTHAVVLQVETETHLIYIAGQLERAGLSHTLIVEPDLRSQATAIGLRPTSNRARVARVLGRLPLLK